MARSGMANLITKLRAACNAGTADTTLAGVTYWSDDQIQGVLDEYSEIWRSVDLEPEAELISTGVYAYYDYEIPKEIGQYFEEAASDSIWAVKSTQGSTLGTANYSINYQARIIRFNTNQAGTIYYLDVRSFNFNRAAANIWRKKAAFAVADVNWESDNHKISAEQEYQHCMEQAKYYERNGGIKASKFFRCDEAWG